MARRQAGWEGGVGNAGDGIGPIDMGGIAGDVPPVRPSRTGRAPTQRRGYGPGQHQGSRGSHQAPHGPQPLPPRHVRRSVGADGKLRAARSDSPASPMVTTAIRLPEERGQGPAPANAQDRTQPLPATDAASMSQTRQEPPYGHDPSRTVPMPKMGGQSSSDRSQPPLGGAGRSHQAEGNARGGMDSPSRPAKRTPVPSPPQRRGRAADVSFSGTHGSGYPVLRVLLIAILVLAAIVGSGLVYVTSIQRVDTVITLSAPGMSDVGGVAKFRLSRTDAGGFAAKDIELGDGGKDEERLPNGKYRLRMYPQVPMLGDGKTTYAYLNPVDFEVLVNPGEVKLELRTLDLTDKAAVDEALNAIEDGKMQESMSKVYGAMTPKAEQVSETVKETDQYRLADMRLERTPGKDTAQIVGTFTNKTDASSQWGEVTFSIKDENGVEIGTARWSADVVERKRTVEFTALSTVNADAARSFEVTGVTFFNGWWNGHSQ